MRAYRVTNKSGNLEIAVYATEIKATKLLVEHPLLELKIEDIEINFFHWVLLRIMWLQEQKIINKTIQ